MFADMLKLPLPDAGESIVPLEHVDSALVIAASTSSSLLEKNPQACRSIAAIIRLIEWFLKFCIRTSFLIPEGTSLLKPKAIQK